MPRFVPLQTCETPMRFPKSAMPKKEPVFITKNGYGDLVVMSIETYEEMLENRALDVSIFEAEAEYAANQTLHDARSALALLRRKHLG